MIHARLKAHTRKYRLERRGSAAPNVSHTLLRIRTHFRRCSAHFAADAIYNRKKTDRHWPESIPVQCLSYLL